MSGEPFSTRFHVRIYEIDPQLHLNGAVYIRRADGEVAAEVNYVSGLIDLEARRLLTDPSREWLSRATRPDLLGLPSAA